MPQPELVIFPSLRDLAHFARTQIGFVEATYSQPVNTPLHRLKAHQRPRRGRSQILADRKQLVALFDNLEAEKAGGRLQLTQSRPELLIEGETMRKYRAEAGQHEECKRSTGIVEETKCLTSYERYFRGCLRIQAKKI